MRSAAKASRSFFGEALAIFGSAVAASAAVRTHRKPSSSDLTTLGIDSKAFDKVHL